MKRRVKKLVTNVNPLVFNDSAGKTNVRKKQRAQRSLAEALQPTCEWATWLARQNGVRKNDRYAVATKRDFAYPKHNFAIQPERRCFIDGGWCEFLFE